MWAKRKPRPIQYIINEKGCHICTSHSPKGSRVKGGYGYPQKRINGKKELISHILWTEKYGPIPTGLFACHHCDNPRCINTDHIFLGTSTDNNRDCANKKRCYYPDYVGEKHPSNLYTFTLSDGRSYWKDLTPNQRTIIAHKFTKNKTDIITFCRGPLKNITITRVPKNL